MSLLSPSARAPAAGLASGVLLAIAGAQVGLGVLSFVALVPLLALIDRGARAAAAAFAGWLAGLVYFGSALAWIPLAGYPPAMLAIAASYVVGLAGTVAALAFALARLRARQRGLWLAAAPLLWITAEYLRAQGPLGYPAHQLGYALVSHPALIQLAAIGGLYALSLWIAAANAALVAALRPGGAARLLLASAVLLLPALPGVRLLAPPAGIDTLRVAAVQPNVREPGRDSSERFRANLDLLVALTEAVAVERPDLVVWPESAFERTLTAAGDPLLATIAMHFDLALLTGAWRVDRSSRELYNSAVLARADGSLALAGDKVHPIPFYERAPDRRFEHALDALGLWRGRFRPGLHPGLVPLGPSGTAAPLLGILICADSSYPALARELRRRGARLLIEISNEARTGRWSAKQHALVSRLRAVETGVPLVRVGNTGPSEWVDARGRVIASLGPGVQAARSARLELAGPPTPYVRHGDAPTFAASALPLIGLLVARQAARRRPETDKETPCRTRSCPG